MDKPTTITQDFAEKIVEFFSYSPENFAEYLAEEFFIEYNISKNEYVLLVEALTSFAEQIEPEALKLVKKWDDEAEEDFKAMEEGRKGNY